MQTSSAQPRKRLQVKREMAGVRKAAEAGAVSNSIIIKSQSTAPRPFTVSRVFAQGDIPHFAKAVFNGEAVDATQCDVKTRWPDGSLKHALVSFWGTPVSGTNIVEFIDQPTGQNEGELPAEAMLSQSYDFGAAMELTAKGQTLKANARDMLANGAFRYWLRGSVCTQVILEDRSPARAYDIGWDEHKSFHPIFVATFYPRWRGVKVELIGEMAWITKIQSYSYSLALKVGNPLNADPVYTKDNFTHVAASRWRKIYWAGPEPAKVQIDYNLPYMIYSRLLPNYDLSKQVPASSVDGEWNNFRSGDRGDIGGQGEWLKYFPTTGGRPDIGVLPRWYVLYLYTFDPKLEEVMLGNAAASGSVPIHYRESTERSYLRDGPTPAFGRVLSIEARPTLWTERLGEPYTKETDRVKVVGEANWGGWTVDCAHQASFAFLPYIITGDWYLLEEVQFWAAWDVAFPNPGNCLYCRQGDWGVLADSIQTRGTAWALRTVGHAAFATPDDTPEKTYFCDKLYNNIAVREGIQDIRDGAFYDPAPGTPWEWGRSIGSEKLPNPLHYMDLADPYGRAYPELVNSVADSPYRQTRVNAPWQYNFMHLVMGHLMELGFPIERLHQTLATHLLNQLTYPGYNHYLAGSSQMPVFQNGYRYYTDWDSLIKGWTPEAMKFSNWPLKDDNDVEHGYPHILRAASSFLPGICDNGHCGAEAWDWVNKHVGYQDALNGNPKWAILPREVQTAEKLQLQVSKRMKPAKTSTGKNARRR